MRVRLTHVRLRTRILAWSFVPSAVILFAVAVVAVYAYSRVTEQEAVQRNQELARLSAANLAAEISQFSLDLGSLTRQSDIAGGRSGRQEAALAAAANKLSIFDAGTIILDAHGILAAAWPKRPADIGKDWASRPYFVQLLRSPRPVYSDITRDGVGGAQVITVAVPITGPQGEFNGVLAGMFRLGATSVSALYGDIAKLRVGVSGDVYLVDGSGRVIAHPDPALVGTDLTSQKVVRRVVSGQTGAERTRDLNHRDVVAGYAPVPGTSLGPDRRRELVDAHSPLPEVPHLPPGPPRARRPGPVPGGAARGAPPDAARARPHARRLDGWRRVTSSTRSASRPTTSCRSSGSSSTRCPRSCVTRTRISTSGWPLARRSSPPSTP